MDGVPMEEGTEVPKPDTEGGDDESGEEIV
jgi:hypothetical protein